MAEYSRLKEIRRIANEISYQSMDRDYYNDVERLKRALDLTARAIGMFAEIEMQKIEGEVVTHDPLGYIESKLGTAIMHVMTPTKNGIKIEPPKPYTSVD